jgi:hypothetical protein
MGNIDRLSRTSVGVIVAVLYFTGVISGTLGIVLLSLATIFVLTSLISFCPLYTFLVYKLARATQRAKYSATSFLLSCNHLVMEAALG